MLFSFIRLQVGRGLTGAPPGYHLDRCETLGVYSQATFCSFKNIRLTPGPATRQI
jgi:hypothetical protein